MNGNRITGIGVRDMKVYIKSSVDDDYLDILYDPKELGKKIADYHNVSQEAAETVARWYIEEDSLGDFDSLDEFLHYMIGDLPDLIDACLDVDEIRLVSEEFGIDVSFLDD